VPVDYSELASIVDSIEALARRVGKMGDAARALKNDGTASELYAVERALTGATRRLSRLVKATRR
jgi:HAMP domain-containing protein